MTKIKICGLYRPEDIAAVNEARPDWCGFIINFPISHRSLTPDQVRALRKAVAEDITPVGVFVDQPVEEIAALLRDGTISVAQLHGHEDDAFISSLREAVPGCVIWKAFRIRSQDDVAAARSSGADLVLLDNGYGTGQTFDWSLIREVGRPFLLAGGLTPENIPGAIRSVAPYGIDISSGVETDKKKDKQKMMAAVSAAREV